jgi:uncharacterized protein (DUF2236 family)
VAGAALARRSGALLRRDSPGRRAFGIDAGRLPRDLDAFETYLDDMLGPTGEVQVGEVARELADAILHPPLGSAVAATGRPFAWLAPIADAIPARAYGWLFWPSIGLLPQAVREGYALPWGFRERAVATWLVAAWQAWRPVLPPEFRQMPQALRADRRVGAAQEAGYIEA